MVIYIIHGYGGNAEENWFPWLQAQLQKLGHTVIVPEFPNSSKPRLTEWLSFFEKYELNSNTIMIGHSLGGAFILSLLEKYKLNAAFFVATVSAPIEHRVDDEIKTFTHKQFNYDIIRKNCNRFYVLHADNDPYILLSQAEALAKRLGVTVTLIRNGGHLNFAVGFRTFPKLLELITKIL